jgi:ribosomal protein L16 Arg81 hydroxylase
VEAMFDLPKLLGSMEPEAFCRDWWEKQPLRVARNHPTYYDGLFSRQDVDSLIAFTQPKFFDNFQPGSPPRRNYITGWLPYQEQFAGQYADLPEIRRAFAGGKTLVLVGVQRRWPAIAAMARQLEAFFGCPVHVNLYLTPPGAQGFEAHFDTHEVFILQIDGSKHWQLYGFGRDLPLSNEKSALTRDEVGTPVQELTLYPGDLLYIPRGYIHDAFTSEQASLHLTVGINVYRWLDLLQQALTDAGQADVRLRQSLPIGLLCADRAPPSLTGKVRELLHQLADHANGDDVVNAMAAAFVSKLSALPHDYFADDDADQVRLDSILERAPGTMCRVVEQADVAVLHAPGARIDGPAKIATALRFIARTERFTLADVPGDLTADAKLALARRLVREKLFTAVNGLGDEGDTPRHAIGGGE